MADTKAEASQTEEAEPRTRAEILDALDDFDGAIKALNGRGLDNLSAEEAAELEGFLDARDELRERLEEMTSNTVAMKARIDAGHSPRRPHLGGVSTPGTGEAPRIDTKAQASGATDSEFEKYVERGPFKSFGHFAYAVRAAGDRPGRNPSGMIADWQNRCLSSDNAIKALYGEDYKAVTGLNEFSDAEGGVLVPTQFAGGIWKRSIDEDFNLLSILRPIPVSGNSLKVRARNDKSRSSGTLYGGVTAYWAAEGAQLTNVKPTYRTIDLSLSKLTVLIPASEELLEDTTAAESEISDTAAGAIRFKVNDALIRGTGVGMPLGFLNATCKVTVTTAAGTGTITAANVDDMWARRPKASGMGMVWLGNQAIEPQLAQLAYTSTNNGATWAYVPGEAFNGAGLPRLKGHTMYYIEQAEDLGTEGDLILLDPAEIAVAVKSTGVKSSVSTHLRFDYDESVFKFTFRMDARPYWDAALTRYKGSNTLSPIVTLESTRT